MNKCELNAPLVNLLQARRQPTNIVKKPFNTGVKQQSKVTDSCSEVNKLRCIVGYITKI
ncbi:hypothetical protein AALB_1831 [Agarivorans albus MKT 106]|uniref:Uncharacterized protein n=1 Tax=Agarivorans albus MKT 106 TaxID=1331007 RepID=R9PT39_AGAAL|nr:hypothetical protein AALB_1831 [Agarivorans albus MKT 106]